MAARVHIDPTPYRPRYPDENVEAGITGGGRAPRGERSRQSGADCPEISLLTQLVEIFSETDHEGVEPLVGEEDVRTEPDGEHGNARLVRQPQGDAHVLGDSRKDDGGRTADPVGGIASEGLALPHLAPDPCSHRLGEGGCPGAHPVHSGDISLARACHSWSDRTSPARLLSAMMASHAAEA